MTDDLDDLGLSLDDEPAPPKPAKPAPRAASTKSPPRSVSGSNPLAQFIKMQGPAPTPAAPPKPRAASAPKAAPPPEDEDEELSLKPVVRRPESRATSTAKPARPESLDEPVDPPRKGSEAKPRPTSSAKAPVESLDPDVVPQSRNKAPVESLDPGVQPKSRTATPSPVASLDPAVPPAAKPRPTSKLQGPTTDKGEPKQKGASAESSLELKVLDPEVKPRGVSKKVEPPEAQGSAESLSLEPVARKRSQAEASKAPSWPAGPKSPENETPPVLDVGFLQPVEAAPPVLDAGLLQAEEAEPPHARKKIEPRKPRPPGRATRASKPSDLDLAAKLASRAQAEALDGQLSAAKASIKLAHSLDPKNHELQELFEQLNRATVDPPKSLLPKDTRVRALYEEARAAEARNDATEAIRVLERAASSRETLILHRLAYLLGNRNGNPARARELFLEVVRREPQNPVFAFDLARTQAVLATLELDRRNHAEAAIPWWKRVFRKR